MGFVSFNCDHVISLLQLNRLVRSELYKVSHKIDKCKAADYEKTIAISVKDVLGHLIEFPSGINQTELLFSAPLHHRTPPHLFFIVVVPRRSVPSGVKSIAGV